MDIPKPVLAILCVLVGFGLGAGVFIATDGSEKRIADIESDLAESRQQLRDAADDASRLESKSQLLGKRVEQLESSLAEVSDDNALLEKIKKLERQAENAGKNMLVMQRKQRDQAIQLDLKQDIIDGYKKRLGLRPEASSRSAPLTVSDTDGGEFQFSNISFRENSVIGRVANNTGRDFDVATWDMSLFSADGELIEVITIVVSKFPAGATRSFDGYSEHGKPRRGRYTIEYSSGF